MATGVSINDATLQGLKDIITAYLEGTSRAEDAVNLTIAGYAALEEILPNADPSAQDATVHPNLLVPEIARRARGTSHSS